MVAHNPSPVLANTAKLAMLQRPYHHNHESSKDSKIREHESSTSQSISISGSVPFLIVHYCVRIAARSGLKSVFWAGNREPLHISERSFHSVWYGHAKITLETLPPSTYDNSPINDTGIEQSLEWLEKAAVADTLLISCDSQRRRMNSRSRSSKEVPVTIIQREERFTLEGALGWGGGFGSEYP